MTARTALLSKGGVVAKPCDGHIDLYPVPADCLGWHFWHWYLNLTISPSCRLISNKVFPVKTETVICKGSPVHTMMRAFLVVVRCGSTTLSAWFACDWTYRSGFGALFRFFSSCVYLSSATFSLCSSCLPNAHRRLPVNSVGISHLRIRNKHSLLLTWKKKTIYVRPSNLVCLYCVSKHPFRVTLNKSLTSYFFDRLELSHHYSAAPAPYL